MNVWQSGSELRLVNSEFYRRNFSCSSIYESLQYIHSPPTHFSFHNIGYVTASSMTSSRANLSILSTCYPSPKSTTRDHSMAATRPYGHSATLVCSFPSPTYPLALPYAGAKFPMGLPSCRRGRTVPCSFPLRGLLAQGSGHSACRGALGNVGR